MKDSSTTQVQITPDMTVESLIKLHDLMREVFVSYGITGCATCCMAKNKTIAQVCSTFEINQDDFIAACQSVLDSGQ